ncbi:DUF2397 family protein, partial [Streptomyces massasporeus]
ERFTRTAKVRDVAAVRAERAERARAERAELARAWQALESDGPVRLSSFGSLAPAVFDRLLDLLGRALAARPDTNGVRRAVTGDGRVEVGLFPPPDDRIAVLTTVKGRLAGPDYVVHIMTAGGVGVSRAPAAAPRETAAGVTRSPVPDAVRRETTAGTHVFPAPTTAPREAAG